MPPIARYAPRVRRNTLFAASLLSLTTLLTAGVAISGPPKAQVQLPPLQKANGNAQIVVKDGKATISVGGPSASAAASAASSLASAAGAQASAATTKLDGIDKARRGVVTIERAGEVLGLGSVLANDGRVITALSPLADGNGLDLRYADGSVVHAKVGHSDRLWDLALLVPQVGRWQEGLQASDADAMKEGAQLRAFAPGKSRAQPASVVLKAKRSLLGADDQMLRDVFEVGTKIGPKEFGSPVVDEAGNVVAVLGRACVPVEKGPCLPTRSAASSAPSRPAPCRPRRGSASRASSIAWAPRKASASSPSRRRAPPTKPA
jgi:serine protease Do